MRILVSATHIAYHKVVTGNSHTPQPRIVPSLGTSTGLAKVPFLLRHHNAVFPTVPHSVETSITFLRQAANALEDVATSSRTADRAISAIGNAKVPFRL